MCTHIYKLEASLLQMAPLHSQTWKFWRMYTERDTDIIQTHTCLHIQTNFIRVDFVTASKWLLHFHGPSDLIFRAFHYFILIKCGKETQAYWEGGRANAASVHCEMEESLENYQSGLAGQKTLLYMNTHVWQCFKKWLIFNQTCC